jgi:hypothetical protein
MPGNPCPAAVGISGPTGKRSLPKTRRILARPERLRNGAACPDSPGNRPAGRRSRVPPRADGPILTTQVIALRETLSVSAVKEITLTVVKLTVSPS